MKARNNGSAKVQNCEITKERDCEIDWSPTLQEKNPMRFWLILIPQIVYFEKQISTREVGLRLGKARYPRWRTNWPQ